MLAAINKFVSGSTQKFVSELALQSFELEPLRSFEFEPDFETESAVVVVVEAESEWSGCALELYL